MLVKDGMGEVTNPVEGGLTDLTGQVRRQFASVRRRSLPPGDPVSGAASISHTPDNTYFGQVGRPGRVAGPPQREAGRYLIT